MKKLSLFVIVAGACLSGHAEENDFAKALRSGARNVVVAMPKYPEEALKNKIVGKVLFEFGLDEKGAPKQVEIITSEPSGVFDDAVKNALSTWRYLPNMASPCNVRTARAQQQIWFEIQDGEPRISMSKVLDLPDIKSVLQPSSNDPTAAVLVPGNTEDNRTLLMKNSGLRYKNRDDVPLEFPKRAMSQGFQGGYVIAIFNAMPDGKVADVSIAYSIPPVVFDNEILRAQRELEVETHDGKPPRRKINVCQEYTFILK